MLVLTRKQNEELVVIDPSGNEIASVMIVAIRGDKVRLGTDAPAQYRVHRREVWEAIKRGGLTVQDAIEKAKVQP